MKKVFGLVFTIALLACMLGCASSKYTGGKPGGQGGGGSSSGTIASGNWSFVGSGTLGSLDLGGYLTVSGTSVSGNMIVVGDGFAVGNSTGPMSVSGTINSGTLTFSGVNGSSTITVTFTGLSGTGLTDLSSGNGTYTVTGGTAAGDTGTMTGTIASSFAGTWQGTESVTSGVMAITFTQATTPNTALIRAGTFPLTASGTGVVFSGVAGCNVTGTLDSTLSFTAGDMVYLNISTTDNTVPGQLIYLGFADDVTSPTKLSGGGYIYSGGSSCMLQNDSPTQHALTLSKQ